MKIYEKDEKDINKIEKVKDYIWLKHVSHKKNLISCLSSEKAPQMRWRDAIICL